MFPEGKAVFPEASSLNKWILSCTSEPVHHVLKVMCRTKYFLIPGRLCNSARVECLLARNPAVRLVLGSLPVGWLLVLQLPLDLFIGIWPELLIP